MLGESRQSDALIGLRGFLQLTDEVLALVEAQMPAISRSEREMLERVSKNLRGHSS